MTDRTAIPRYRAYTGPSLLRQGFRPFFLGAGLWAAVAMGLWLGALDGRLWLPSAFDALAWHAHEMIFGYVVAVIAGFLLTAIPNWTGRMPIQGLPLGGLVLLWVAGRLAVALGQSAGVAAAAIDLAFLAVLLAVVLREILAGRNWRNLPMAAALALLLIANGLSHGEALGLADSGGAGQRLGVAVALLLITLVGGRIVPSFTRNWLVKRDNTRLPASFGAVDRVALAATAAALVAWVLAPGSTPTGGLAALAAAALALRLVRWRGVDTGGEPLLWILHVGYAWLPVGFALLALATLADALPPSAALHALTAGAMGTMTLAVMTRATLGHTGRPLTAGAGTTAIYLLVVAAVVLRIAAGLGPMPYLALLAASGTAWVMAFALFVALYAGPLTRSGPEDGA